MVAAYEIRSSEVAQSRIQPMQLRPSTKKSSVQTKKMHDTIIVKGNDLQKAGVEDGVKIELPIKQRQGCHDCHINSVCLNQSLSDNTMDSLQTIARHPKPVRKGKHIYRRNDDFSSIFIVRSGSIKLYQLDQEGEEHITGFYLPGELFGMDGMLKGHHICSAEALDTTSICEIPFTKLENSFLTDPDLQRVLVKALCNEIHERQQPLLLLHHKHAEERLATFLVDISNRLNKLGQSATEFNLPMPRRDIAHYLGMTEETISRLFTRLQNNKLISASRRNIKIRDLTSLKGMALSVL